MPDAKRFLDRLHDFPFVNRADLLVRSAARGPYPKATAILHCDSTSWGRVLFANLPLEDSGAQMAGDLASVAGLLSCFETTVPAGATS